jgi:hypothetical protein
VTLFLAKLLLTPTIMYLTSATGRRWGPGVSGWLMGLPMLAGPINVFVCIEQGTPFATHAAATTLFGLWASCAFCAAYRLTSRFGWHVAVPAAVAGYGVTAALLQHVEPAPWLGLAGVYAGAALLLGRMGSLPAVTAAAAAPAWDMPLRLVIAAAFVILQTGIAGWLGPQLSGLVTPYPIVLTLLTAFSHQQQGSASALRLHRGFLIGMYAFSSFFLVAALSLGRLGAFAAYSLALLTCLLINGATLWTLRRGL